MEANDIPPILSEIGKEPEPATPPKARWRWWVHVVVLASFPIYVCLGSLRMMSQAGEHQETRLLPESAAGLVRMTLEGVLIFLIFFVAAWLVSRVTGAQLLLRWRRGGIPLLWGLAYSVGLRILLVVVIGVPLVAWKLLSGSTALQPDDVRDRLDHLVRSNAVTDNPVYLALALTLVSFVLGGLREELWRSAMLAGIKQLFPKGFERTSGKVAAVLVVAALFGSGHISQGGLGVAMASVVGAALGAIMLWHRSIWEATIAHGLFDASTFVMIYLVTKYPPHFLQPH
jgi:membrane protease YdiL (CAAX protease family)